MKNFTTLFFIFCVALMQAQHINDAHFANAIHNQCASCIDANQDLTVNASALTELYVSHDTISDLTGLDGFTNLHYLVCEWNNISVFPALPPNLVTLVCNENQIAVLPPLPSSLVYLECGWNLLTSLPILPSSMQHLLYRMNQVSALPTLPAGLSYLDCAENNMSSLTSVPAALDTLICMGDPIQSLPFLPSTLKYIDCWNCQLTSLPALPSSLKFINCSGNSMPSLPALPGGLEYLTMESNNAVTQLPALPSTLEVLYVNSCAVLTSLPSLPNSLVGLHCAYCQLSNLPLLPSNLILLECSGNLFQHLPALPSLLNSLTSWQGQLVDLPPLPPQLQTLQVDDNFISELPLLPSNLGTLQIMNNPISCLPFLPNGLAGLYISGTNITCMPNYPASLPSNGLPLCDIGNTNGCEVYPFIKGKVFVDTNGDGIQNNGEVRAPGIIVEAEPGEYMAITDALGNYVMAVPFDSTYTVSVPEFSDYYAPPTTTYTVTFDSTSGQTSGGNNFGLLPLNVGDDLYVDVSFSHHPVPGFNSNSYITVQNIGTTDLLGTATLTFDNLLSFVSTVDTPYTLTGNQVAWDFSGLAPFQTRVFTVTLSCPTNAVLGTMVYNSGVGTLTGATDVDPADNSDTDSITVSSSFDPNEKLVSAPILTPQEVADGKYLEYTITFQNTGTAPATFIYVVDTLSSNLDPASFHMISASHPYGLTLANDLTKAGHPLFVKWLFNNINLPDSSTDELNSHGYVKFRIKAREDLTLGEQINNNASIIFDFNQPVVTNTVTTVVGYEALSSIGDHSFSAALYPNPASDFATLHFDNVLSPDITIDVIDPTGRILSGEKVDVTGSSFSVDLDLSKFQNGLYFIRVSSSDKMQLFKLVKNSD